MSIFLVLFPFFIAVLIPLIFLFLFLFLYFYFVVEILPATTTITAFIQFRR